MRAGGVVASSIAVAAPAASAASISAALLIGKVGPIFSPRAGSSAWKLPCGACAARHWPSTRTGSIGAGSRALMSHLRMRGDGVTDDFHRRLAFGADQCQARGTHPLAAHADNLLHQLDQLHER